MNKPSSESLKVNPFTAVRDPETGIWLVCFPDGTVKNNIKHDAKTAQVDGRYVDSHYADVTS